MNANLRKSRSLALVATAFALTIAADAQLASAIPLTASTSTPTGNVEIQQLTSNNGSDFKWRTDGHVFNGQTFTVGSAFGIDKISILAAQELDPPDRTLVGHTMRINIFSVSSLTDTTGTTVLSQTGVTDGTWATYGTAYWLTFDVTNTLLPAGLYGFSLDFDFLKDASLGFPGGHRVGSANDTGIRYADTGNPYAGGQGFRIGSTSMAAGADIAFVIQSGPVVPEPSSFVLAGLGLVGAIAARRRRRS